MSNLKSHLYAEFLKIISNRATKVVLAIIWIAQPSLGYITSQQLLATGLDATPATHPNLVEAVPPIAYIGFDSVLLGLFAILILGAMLGGAEFRKESLRTSLLLNPNKSKFFIIKMLIT